MPFARADTNYKECESLILKFIKLKQLLNGMPSKPNSILKDKIPNLKEIYSHLQKK